MSRELTPLCGGARGGNLFPPRSEWNVPVLTRRQGHLLVDGHVERFDERGPGLLGLDDVVDVPALRRVIRVGELLAVLVDQLASPRRGIVRGGDLALEYDVDCPL